MITLSWLDIDDMVRALADQLRERRFDAVVGIARSGLVPAVMLSHALGVREFAILDIRRTLSDDIRSAKHHPVLRGALNLGALADRKILLVDDVVGAGDTLQVARAELDAAAASVVTASLVVNRANLKNRTWGQVIDHCARLTEDWVVFPWECKQHGDVNVDVRGALSAR
jgi:uncharacterized protein